MEKHTDYQLGSGWKGTFAAVATVFLLAAPALADGGSCPKPRSAVPYLDYSQLQVVAQAERADAAAHDAYALDESLTGRAPAATEATEKPPVAIEAEQDMAAVRFNTETPVTPYVGAGMAEPKDASAPGAANPDPAKEEQPTPFLGAGIGCDLGNSTRLSLGYRYTPNTLVPPGLGSGPQTTDPTADPDSYDFSFGLKVGF